MENILEDSLFDTLFFIKILKTRRLTFHKEAVNLYGPLYFTHPDYLNSELGYLLNLTHETLEEKETDVLRLTNLN